MLYFWSLNCGALNVGLPWPRGEVVVLLWVPTSVSYLNACLSGTSYCTLDPDSWRFFSYFIIVFYFPLSPDIFIFLDWGNCCQLQCLFILSRILKLCSKKTCWISVCMIYIERQMNEMISVCRWGRQEKKLVIIKIIQGRRETGRERSGKGSKKN